MISRTKQLTDRLVHWRRAWWEAAPGKRRPNMPLLLEDLEEETSASNRRMADRLDAETRELERLAQALDALHGRK